MLFPLANDKESMLGKLSIDIFGEIISYLDSYSTVHLIEAYPELKRFTILITDHQFPAMFFDCNGLKRKALANAFTWDHDQPIDLELYDGTTDSSLIKLFELAYPQSLKDFLDVKDDIASNPFQRNKLNRTSFVFVKTDLFDTKQTALLAEHLDEYTSCNWHFGLPARFPMDGLSNEWFDPQRFKVLPEAKQWPSNQKLGPVVHNELGLAEYYDMVRSLRLVNVMELVDLEFPMLLDLALIYPSKEGPRPVVSNITAPLLRKLVIHYNGKVPHLEKMENIATEGLISEFEKRPNTMMLNQMDTSGKYLLRTEQKKPLASPNQLRCFELAYIPCLQGNRDSFVGEVEEEDFDEVMPSISQWLCKFDVVHMFGVHSNIFTPKIFNSTLRLRLNLMDPVATDLQVEYNRLESISLGLYRNGMLIPVLFWRKPPPSFHLMIMSPMVNLERLDVRGISVNYDHGRPLRQLTLYRSVPLLKKSRPFGLLRRAWEWFFLVLKYAEISCEISIVGFSMGWFLTQRAQVSFRFPAYLRLRPVVQVNPSEESRLTLNTVGWGWGFNVYWGTTRGVAGSNTDIMISPITCVRDSEGIITDISPRPLSVKILNPPAVGQQGVGLLKISVGGHVTSCVLVSNVLLKHKVSEEVRYKKRRMAEHDANITFFRSLDHPNDVATHFESRNLLHSWTITPKPPRGERNAEDDLDPYGFAAVNEEDKLVQVGEDNDVDYGTHNFTRGNELNPVATRAPGHGAARVETNLRLDTRCHYEPAFTLL